MKIICGLSLLIAFSSACSSDKMKSDLDKKAADARSSREARAAAAVPASENYQNAAGEEHSPVEILADNSPAAEAESNPEVAVSPETSSPANEQAASNPLESPVADIPAPPAASDPIAQNPSVPTAPAPSAPTNPAPSTPPPVTLSLLNYKEVRAESFKSCNSCHAAKN